MKNNIPTASVVHCYETIVQPYNEKLRIMVVTSAIDARRELPDILGPGEKDEREVAAQCVDGPSGMTLVFRKGASLTHGTITHEVFHATHRILRWVGDRFSNDHEEPYAYLADWITDQVYAQLKKAKVRVR